MFCESSIPKEGGHAGSGILPTTFQFRTPELNHFFEKICPGQTSIMLKQSVLIALLRQFGICPSEIFRCRNLSSMELLLKTSSQFKIFCYQISQLTTDDSTPVIDLQNSKPLYLTKSADTIAASLQPKIPPQNTITLSGSEGITHLDNGVDSNY